MDFTCPKCENTFTDVNALNEHMEREHADKLSFPTMSLASDGTISYIWETCKTCGKVFENELDLKNHMERVHVYGELFQLYPCEECGFRASDLTELRIHHAEGHPADESISSISEHDLSTGTPKAQVKKTTAWRNRTVRSFFYSVHLTN